MQTLCSVVARILAICEGVDSFPVTPNTEILRSASQQPRAQVQWSALWNMYILLYTPTQYYGVFTTNCKRVL